MDNDDDDEDDNKLEEQPSGNVELVECPEGCGRKFNPQALKKHKKNCKKVFQ